MYCTPRFECSQRGGRRLCIGEYKFNRHSSSRGLKSRWNCNRTSYGCKATVITYEDVVVKVMYDHNHYQFPRTYAHSILTRAVTLLEPQPVFTKSRFGKPVIQIGAYRFNKCSGRGGPRARYVCVKACYGCRATIITLNDEIVSFCREHNH
ncbi:unnamed protein product, partial [Iphiclides podalirius]